MELKHENNRPTHCQICGKELKGYERLFDTCTQCRLYTAQKPCAETECFHNADAECFCKDGHADPAKGCSCPCFSMD